MECRRFCDPLVDSIRSLLISLNAIKRTQVLDRHRYDCLRKVFYRYLWNTVSQHDVFLLIIAVFMPRLGITYKAKKAISVTHWEKENRNLFFQPKRKIIADLSHYNPFHTMLEEFKNAVLFPRLGLPFTLIRHENRAVRKRASNRSRNLKTSALLIFLETELFENDDVKIII